MGTSILVQWIKIRLPMPGTWVQTLIWEETTCLGATESMCTASAAALESLQAATTNV